MIVDVIVGLVSAAIYSGIEATASGLAKPLSKPEKKELERVYQQAFTTTFEPLFARITDDVLQEHIGDLLKEFVSDAKVSSQFIQMALAGANPNRQIMVKWFNEQDYDLKSLPIVPKLLVNSLVNNLAVVLEDSASNHESALYNRVSIALLKQIRDGLATSKADDDVDTPIWTGDVPQSPRIFISYARSDGSPFAKILRKRLIHIFGEKAIWRDRDEMEGGVGWWNQIQEALEAVSFMVLVATPNAMQSEVVAKEWRTARQLGVCVYPVQVPDAPIDFNRLPRWMRDSHFYNLAEEWDTFINYLKHPCEALRVPFMAEAPPPHFVNRPQLMNELLQRLLDTSRQNPIAITTALKGSGGFGKTTLAQALCADEDVQTAFDDGILWATLGENPNVELELKKLYKALTGKEVNFSDVEEGGRELAKALTDKDCLIVIDDVWNSVHLQPFLRGGERCARLITTRDYEIGVRANAFMTEVDEMRETEARALLRGGVDTSITDAQLDALSVRLGRWALMLELANSIIKVRHGSSGGGTWADAYAYIIKLLDKRGVNGIQTNNAEKRKQGADGVLSVSLELLAEDERAQLCQLGIFKDDQDVPVSSVMALWGMDDFDTEELLTKFARLSLIKYRSSTASIRLHDVVREYFLTKLDDVVAVHDQLLRGYADPYTLPDTYAWRFYAYHLTGANRLAELRPLLLSYRWLDMKLRQTDPNAVLEDFTVWLSGGVLLKINSLKPAEMAKMPNTTTPRIKDEPVRIVRSAFSNSLHRLVVDKRALAHQLAGRLMHHRKDHPDIQIFIENIIPPKNSLFPLMSDFDPLNPAGGYLDAILMGHTGDVNGAVVLGDRRILSWSGDKTLRLWDRYGAPIATLKGHTEYVNGAMVLGDGRILSWSSDKILRLWDANGTPLATLTGHMRSVNGAVVLGDGRILSWSDDETLRLWDASGVPIAVLSGHDKAVNGAQELADGRLLSWSDDKTLRLWTADGTPITTLMGHEKAVNGAQELADGRLLSWSDDKTLRLWTADGTPITTLMGHEKAVNGAQELADGRLLSWSLDKTLRLWTADGTPITTLTGSIGSVTDTYELVNRRLLSWGTDKTLRLWTIDGDPIATLTGHRRDVRGARELADGRILSWSLDKTLRLWTADGVPIATLMGHEKAVNGAQELADERILSWSDDNALHLWTVDGVPIAIVTRHTGSVRGVLELADGRLLSWSADETLCLWTVNGVPIATLMGHTGEVGGARELADGRILSWSHDNTLRLWTIDGVPIATLTGHIGEVGGARELTDGRILSWSHDNTLRLWTIDGVPIATLTGHIGEVRGARELADGRILSWSSDKMFCLWTTNGALIDVLTQSYWIGDRQIMGAWARKHGYTLDDIYPPKEALLMAGGRVQHNGTDLIITDPRTGETIHTFYGDAPFSGGVAVLAGGRVLVVGDSVGRVLFLRWVGEDES